MKTCTFAGGATSRDAATADGRRLSSCVPNLARTVTGGPFCQVVKPSSTLLAEMFLSRCNTEPSVVQTTLVSGGAAHLTRVLLAVNDKPLKGRSSVRQRC